MGLRTGDVVWARVVFPKKWWPGLVRSIDGHRVAVSFFDDGEDSHYFLETEVLSFEENFESLVKTLKSRSRGEELLVTALDLLARRVAYSLRCPCHFRPSSPGGIISKRSRRSGESVQPDALLSLVLSLAVSPFVGELDFVGAVTMASQLNVFRRYLVAEQKFRHPKTTGACSVAQSTDVSKLEFESLNDDLSNSGSWVLVNNANTQSLPKNMCGLAFDDNHTTEGCLSKVQQNCMPIRTSGCQAIFNFEIRKCFPGSSELQLCQPSVKVNGKDSQNISNKTYLSNPTKYMGLKRKYDHPVYSDFRFKLCKSMPLFSMSGVHTDNRKSKIGRNVCELEAFSLKPFFSDHSLKLCNKMPFSFANCTNAVGQRCEENTPDSFSLDLFDKASVETIYYLSSPSCSDNYNFCVETNRLESINAAFSFKGSPMANKLHLPVVTSDALLSIPHVAQQSVHTSVGNHKVSIGLVRHDSRNGAFSSRERSVGNKQLLPLVASEASSSLLPEAQESVNATQVDHSKDNHSSSVENSGHESINAVFTFKEISTEKNSQVALQSANAIQMEHSTSIDTHKVFKKGRQDSIKVTFCSREDCMENKLMCPLVTSNAHLSTLQEAQLTANASIQMDHSRDMNISIKDSRHERINAAFSFKESFTEKNSRVNEQSAQAIYGSCQNLYMKFPRDSILPSKKDLIRKFNRFGQIDLFRTAVSVRLGSAQVVFLHHLDAIAAYQYAKRKKCLFGGANVLFWLDPYEKKRSHSRFAASIPKLKSCLKSPYARRQEDKKQPRKVRFLMET